MTYPELIENINRLNRLRTRLNNVLHPTVKNSVDFTLNNLNLQAQRAPLLVLHIFYQAAIQQICVSFNQMNLGNYSIDILEEHIASVEERLRAEKKTRDILNAPRKLRFSASELQRNREEELKKPDNLTIEKDMQESTNNSKKIKAELEKTDAEFARKKLIF